ncbi:hypothetical protein B0H13DRAFT_2268234 [Mycena leptocephala]|nr:hypothetical protein B0H13DRAFT_2268234 [Mycena leptocephala]
MPNSSFCPTELFGISHSRRWSQFGRRRLKSRLRKWSGTQSLTPGKAQLSREEHNKWMARAVARYQEEQRRLGKTDQLNMSIEISDFGQVFHWPVENCSVSPVCSLWILSDQLHSRQWIENEWNKRAREAGVSESAIITFVNEVDNEAVPPEVDVLCTYLEIISMISESLNPELWLDVDPMVEQNVHGLFKFNMYSKIIECNEAKNNGKHDESSDIEPAQDSYITSSVTSVWMKSIKQVGKELVKALGGEENLDFFRHGQEKARMMPPKQNFPVRLCAMQKSRTRLVRLLRKVSIISMSLQNFGLLQYNSKHMCCLLIEIPWSSAYHLGYRIEERKTEGTNVQVLVILER